MSSTNAPQQTDKDLDDVFFRTCSDVLKETLGEHELKQPLRRLIIIGNILYSNHEDIKKKHQEFIKAIQNGIQEVTNKISGNLIIHENFFYHICESSDEFLGEIIEETAALVANKVILGAKVIHTNGIVQRYFNGWNSCIVKTPSYRDSEEEVVENSEESSVLAIAQMIKKLEDAIFVLASFLKFVPPDNLEETINELLSIGVLLFKKELIDLYSEKFFLTAEEHVETYLNQREYISFVEQEWPPTSPIQDPIGFFDELDRFEKEVDKNLRLEEEQKKMKAKPGVFWWTVKTSK